MADTIITVQGEYELRRPAELGLVRIRLDVDGDDREKTLGRALALHSEITAGLRERRAPATGPVVEWSSDQVRVWGERPWSQDGRRLALVFHAQASIEATFADCAALTDWVSAVAVRDGVSVLGIEWSLTIARRQSLTQEARRRAVENAVAKATVYATSLGLNGVRPLALSDPGMLGDGHTVTGSGPQLFATRTLATETSGATLSLNPEDITIAVQVHARFAAS